MNISYACVIRRVARIFIQFFSDAYIHSKIDVGEGLPLRNNIFSPWIAHFPIFTIYGYNLTRILLPSFAFDQHIEIPYA